MGALLAAGSCTIRSMPVCIAFPRSYCWYAPLTVRLAKQRAVAVGALSPQLPNCKKMTRHSNRAEWPLGFFRTCHCDAWYCALSPPQPLWPCSSGTWVALHAGARRRRIKVSHNSAENQRAALAFRRVPDELKKHYLSDGEAGQYSTNLDRNRYGSDDQYLFTVVRYDLEYLNLCPCMVDVEIIDAKNAHQSIFVSAGPEACTCQGAAHGHGMHDHPLINNPTR